MLTYQEFYAAVTLPRWAPPGWVFGVAWGIIYPLLAIATVWVLYRTVTHRMPVRVVLVLAVNWAANLAFTPIQLGLTPLWPASIDILLVLGTLAYLKVWAWRRDRLLFWLLVPYALWATFATVLQLTITFTN